MKSVLISINPKWVEKIVNGEKTIEVRKTAPKCETPFKCYIYMTQGKLKDLGIYSEWVYKNRMKVIGEFICDKVYPIKNRGSRFSVADEEQSVTNEIARQSCLDYDDMVSYFSNKDGFGWHISDLKIYDKPKELSEFKTPSCEKSEKACGNCKWLVKINTPDVYECECYVEDGRPITRPPQSWCYVEDLGEEE